MGTTYEHGQVYWGKVVEQRFGENKKGNPQFNVTFQIRGQIDPFNPEGDLVKCPVFERTAFMPITEGTASFVAEHVQRLSEAKGIVTPLQSWAQLNPEHPKFTHDFVGAELGFYCKHEAYEGNVNEKWSVARGTGGSRPEVGDIDDKKMRNLDALFGKFLPGAKAVTPAAPPQANQQAATKPRMSKQHAAAVKAQAPLDDGPAPWDTNDAPPAEDIPF